MSPAESDTPFIVVWETQQVPHLALARSILDSADIPYFVQGEEALQLLPLGTFGSGLFTHGVGARIFVPTEQAEEARSLLAQLSADDEGEET